MLLRNLDFDFDDCSVMVVRRGNFQLVDAVTEGFKCFDEGDNFFVSCHGVFSLVQLSHAAGFGRRCGGRIRGVIARVLAAGCRGLTAVKGVK